MSKPFFLLVLFVAAMLPIAACSKGASEPKLPPPDQTYTTSGVIDAMPGPRRGQYLRIHHERIPEFVDMNGEIVGMREMVMDFEGVDPAVKLAEFAPGDKIEFTFEVRWGEGPRSYVTQIIKLPPDTTLDLSDLSEPDEPSEPAEDTGAEAPSEPHTGG